MKLHFIAGLLCVVSTACSQPEVEAAAEVSEEASTPATLCIVDAVEYDVVASACVPGQKVFFGPSRWGNEQLPVLFAAINCDLSHSVALTNGAVTCIYGPIEPVDEDADVDEDANNQAAG